MNYYPRHVGDFVSATAHLSMLEDGAYNRLLDWYYQDEKPLPADKRVIYRRIRASTEAEREAVDIVLAEFFVMKGDAYTHARCDAEIAKARDKGEDAESRKTNERERQQRHRARRKELFETLRGHGEVPPFDTPTNELETLLSRVTGRDRDSDVTPHATAIANSQEPIANSQEPRTKNQEDTSSRRSDAGAHAPASEQPKTPKRMAKPMTPLPDWVPLDAWNRWVEARKASGKRLTDGAREVAVRELTRLRADGHDPALVLDQSTLRGWIGLFPVKADNRAQQTGPPNRSPIEERNAAFASEWTRGLLSSRPPNEPQTIEMEPSDGKRAIGFGG